MTVNQQVTRFTCAGENNCQLTGDEVHLCRWEWVSINELHLCRWEWQSINEFHLCRWEWQSINVDSSRSATAFTCGRLQSDECCGIINEMLTSIIDQRSAITAASSTYARQTLILLTWHLFSELLQVEPRHLKRVSVDKCPACEKYLCHATDSKNYVKNRLIAEKYHQQASLISCWCANWHHRQGMTALWQENVISLLTFK